MRYGYFGLVSPMVLASTMATAACSDSSGTNAGTGGAAATTGGGSSSGGNATSSGGNATSSGGQQSTGGSATGGTPSCTNLNPCGGDLVGTWRVTSSCLTVNGELDLSVVGFDCTRGQITSGGLQVTAGGTWKANSDTTFEDTTTTTGDVDFALVESCLHWSGTVTTCDGLGRSAIPSVGFDSFPNSSCQNAATGGGCTCRGHVNHSAGIGVISVVPVTGGNYTISGTGVTLSDGFYSASYSYCVQGNTLTLTPQTTLPVTTGTIVLQKQ